MVTLSSVVEVGSNCLSLLMPIFYFLFPLDMDRTLGHFSFHQITITLQRQVSNQANVK